MWAKRMDSAGSRSGDTSFRGAVGARKPEFMRVHAANYGVYGARKVWLALTARASQWPAVPSGG